MGVSPILRPDIMTATRSARVVAGIDVGGAKKGFHAVALTGWKLAGKCWSADPREIAKWCVNVGATVVGVDAPIAWSASGRARHAERALMQAGVWCFSTPSEETALSHRTNHYGWMRNGTDLYLVLKKRFKLYDGRNDTQRPIAFETFPHAITCSLLGRVVPASDKRRVRRELLAELNVSCEALTNIDLVDAALCAVTAEYFARQRFQKHGDPAGGYIVLPES